jgi:hypothetical protein
MDPSQLSDADLAQLHNLLGRMQRQPTQPQSAANPPASTDIRQLAISAPPLTPMAAPAPTISPLTIAGTNPLAVGPVGPYQSVRLPSLAQAPQGHPSPAMSQPFLGRGSFMAVNTSELVNQQRRASAVASQPRQLRLPSRGRRRGPAVPPPSLPRNSVPCIEDCVSTTIHNGVEIPALRIKLKIYPPQVSIIHHCVALNKAAEASAICIEGD